MSAQWFFQMMGAEIGPLSGPQLLEKVKLGQIQPDTLVRKGKDGKWQAADRWKGLLPSKNAEPVESSAQDEDDPEETTTPAPEQPPLAKAPATPASAPATASTEANQPTPADDDDDATYHVAGDQANSHQPFQEPGEYDFFQFVGYRHAITPAIYDLLCEYSSKNRLTLTQITRRALAQFLGKPELGEEKKPDAPPQAAAE